MSGAYTLYGGGTTRSVAVEIVLLELALPYELVEIDTAAGEHRLPGFLDINPAGYLPALVTPTGEVLHENAAIILWLADAHDAVELAPAPGDERRGVFLSKLFYHTNDIQPAIKRYFYASRYAPDAGTVDRLRARAREVALERWTVLDDYLSTHGPHHLGERYSLLDPHMAVWAAYGLDTSDEVLKRFDAVRRCFELAAARPRSGAALLEFQKRVEAWRRQSADEVRLDDRLKSQ